MSIADPNRPQSDNQHQQQRPCYWYWSPGWNGRWGYGLLWRVWEVPKYPGGTKFIR
jgi:hypothetical protein